MGVIQRLPDPMVKKKCFAMNVPSIRKFQMISQFTIAKNVHMIAAKIVNKSLKPKKKPKHKIKTIKILRKNMTPLLSLEKLGMAKAPSATGSYKSLLIKKITSLRQAHL